MHLVPFEIPHLKIDLSIASQPTDTSCGPTCLHALYKYYGYSIELPKLIDEIPTVEGGGTFAVLLGADALTRGFRVTTYTYNLDVFDPTWFALSRDQLQDKLRQSLKVSNKSFKVKQAIKAYSTFLELGGEILFEDLSGSLIRKYLKLNKPILTGLSSTFLYQSPREVSETNESNDLLGAPAGHFVMLCGYDNVRQEVYIADPYDQNPLHKTRYYAVPMDRLITAILLGVYTYDGNLLIIRPFA
jgi:hypothetical protein